MDFCTFTKQSGTAKLLQASSLIIWDEPSMAKRQSVEALDKSLRDIMDRPELSFGGKTVVFSGDSSCCLERVKGSGGRCLAAYVVPLGFHATSKTSAQHEGKERPHGLQNTCCASVEVLRRRLLMMKSVFLMIYVFRTPGKIVILIL